MDNNDIIDLINIYTSDSSGNSNDPSGNVINKWKDLSEILYDLNKTVIDLHL